MYAASGSRDSFEEWSPDGALSSAGDEAHGCKNLRTVSSIQGVGIAARGRSASAGDKILGGARGTQAAYVNASGAPTLPTAAAAHVGYQRRGALSNLLPRSATTEPNWVRLPIPPPDPTADDESHQHNDSSGVIAMQHKIEIRMTQTSFDGTVAGQTARFPDVNDALAFVQQRLQHAQNLRELSARCE